MARTKLNLDTPLLEELQELQKKERKSLGALLEVYREVTQDTSERANLVPDAHLASILRQHGISTLFTHNVGDFEKFGFLDVRNPFTA